MKLYPINKFIVVEPVEERNTSTVLLPEGYTNKGDVKAYRVVTAPTESKIPEGCKLIALSNMVNKFTFEGVTFHVVPDSAVIGYFAGI
jgi:hypothetical protein